MRMAASPSVNASAAGKSFRSSASKKPRTVELADGCTIIASGDAEVPRASAGRRSEKAIKSAASFIGNRFDMRVLDGQTRIRAKARAPALRRRPLPAGASGEHAREAVEPQLEARRLDGGEAQARVALEAAAELLARRDRHARVE